MSVGPIRAIAPAASNGFFHFRLAFRNNQQKPFAAGSNHSKPAEANIQFIVPETDADSLSKTKMGRNRSEPDVDMWMKPSTPQQHNFFSIEAP